MATTTTTTTVPSAADVRAEQAVLDHHTHLLRGLHERVSELRVAVSHGAAYNLPLAALSAYLATEILPHAAAEEAAVYPAAAATPTAKLFVETMLIDHEELTSRTRSLTNAADPYSALGLAEAVTALFEAHVRKENDLLLPVLRHTEGISLSALLHNAHERLAGDPA